MRSLALALAAFLSVAPFAAAKTNLAGCVSTATTDQYGDAVLSWYVPDTYEICSILDCGGGRAPPKTTVPGCAAYSGTATYSPQYLDVKSTAASATSETASATGGSAGESAAGSETGTITQAPGSTSTGSAMVAGTGTTVTMTKGSGSKNGTVTASGPQSTGTGSVVNINGAGVMGFSAAMMGVLAAVAVAVV